MSGGFKLLPPLFFGGGGAFYILKWIFNPPGIKYLKTTWITWSLTKMICSKKAPTHFEMGKNIPGEDENRTLFNHRIQLSLRQSSHGKEECPWWTNAGPSLTQQLLTIPSCSISNTGHILTENKCKGSCPPDRTRTHCPRMLSRRQWHTPAQAVTGIHASALPSQPQTLPQANNEGAKTAAEAQCASPQGGPFSACPQAPPEEEVSLYSIGHETSWLCDQLAGSLWGSKDGKGLVSPTGTSFPMQEAQPNHF